MAPHETVMKAENLRFAHSDGFTDICFSVRSGKLVSAGDDGYACLWTDGVSDDSQMMHQLGDSVNCISVSDDTMHAVIANNTLSEFDFPSCSFKRICLKLSDQITHFAANNSYSTLAVGSSDFKIRLLDRESLQVPVSLSDHQAPILSLSFSASEEFLASSSCDSTVRLWSPKDGKCVSTFGRVLPKSNDVANSPTLCRLQFSNDSTKLYVPTEGEIKVYDVRNWHKPCEKIDLPKKTLSASYVRFSKSGQYFASICKDVLGVYSVAKKQWISRLNHSKPLCVVAWHPFTGNRLAFTDSRGQLGFVSAPIDEAGSTASNMMANDVAMADEDDADLLAVAAELGDDDSSSFGVTDNVGSKAKESDKPKISFSDDEEDDDSITKIDKTSKVSKADAKKHQLKNFTKTDDDDESNMAPLRLEEDEDSNEEQAITDLGRIRSEFKEFFDDEDEDDDDDDDGKLPRSDAQKGQQSGKTSTPTKSVTSHPVAAAAPSKPADAHLQRAFQVHSTPTGRGGQNSRFLVWNQLGVVRLYETDSESSVEVEFHDASVHPPISLTSSDEITLGALTTDVLVLCSISASNDEDDEGSQNCRIRVLTLSAWDSSREWFLDLPSGEICVAVAVGSRWIAVVTDKHFVRLFSLAGFQTGILSIAGTPVTACGKDDHFAVVYHNGIGAKECQNMAFDLYRFDAKLPKLVSSGCLPVSPRCTLNWAAFGQDYGTLCTADTGATVRAYSVQNRSWTPVANLRKCGQIKSRADHYWMVGLSERFQQIYAIFCKASTYPSVLPRPILSTVPLGVPICDVATDSGKLADEAIRLRLFSQPGQQEESDIKLQETLMRLFAIALKQERQCRAAEIAESMPTSTAIQLAGKYAARLRLGHLADMLNDMALKRQMEIEQSQPVEEDPFAGGYGYSAGPSVYAPSVPAEDKQALPVLATPPVVTLVKRPVGHTPSGLAKDFAPPPNRHEDTNTRKSNDSEDDDEPEEVEEKSDTEEVRDDEEESEPIISRNPFAKAPASRGNPFKKVDASSAPRPSAGSTGDALSCFEKVENRPKVSSAVKEATTTSGRKKKLDKEEGASSAKKKRTATKRKSENVLAQDDEGSNSKGSRTENDDGENENSKDVEEPSIEKSSKKPASTAPNPSTIRKLTDFMFSKNN